MNNKKAVFAYTFSMENAGDFSLNIAAVSLLIKNGYSVTLISRFEDDSHQFIETSQYFNKLYGDQVHMISSPFKLDRNTNKLRKLKNNIHGALVSSGILKNKLIQKEVQEADIVVLCGGNILRCGSFTDFMRLKALNYPLSLAKKYNKKYFIFPQSTADINYLGKKILGSMINNAEAVFLREELSFNKINTLFPQGNNLKTLDLAFFLLDESSFKKSNDKKRIAFTIRDGKLAGIGNLSDSQKNDIEKGIINAVLSLVKSYEIDFIVQGDINDKLITHKIQNDLKTTHSINISIIEEKDTFKLIELYSNYDLLIGMRLHSIILAAIAGTPSYGYFIKEWGLKNPGILQMINLPYNFVDNGGAIKLKDAEELLDKKEEFQDFITNLVANNNDLIHRELSK